jgi:hypothetical protein
MIVKASCFRNSFSFHTSFSKLKTSHMRKFIILTAASVFFSLFVNAQISKGAVFLGGSLFVQSWTQEVENSTSKTANNRWGINPQIGKAVANNKIVGLSLSFSRSHYKQEPSIFSPAETKENSYGAGVFYRSYFPFGSKFSLFEDAGFGVGVQKENRWNNTGSTNMLYYKSKGIGGGFSLAPGVSYTVTKKVLLEASITNMLTLYYNSAKVTEYSAPNVVSRESNIKSFTGNATINPASNFSIGVRFLLANK